MWMMILFLPLAILIGRAIAVLPHQYRRVPVFVGITFLIPVILLVSIPVYQFAYGSPMQALSTFMLLLAALACYYFIRGASLLGMIGSYFKYGHEKKVDFPLLLPFLAWMLTILEPVAVIALFLGSYFMEWPGRLDANGFGETSVVLQMIFAAGVVISSLILIWIYEQRTLVSEYVKEKEAEDKAAALRSGVKPGVNPLGPKPGSKPGWSGTKPAPPPQFKRPTPPLPNSPSNPSKRFGGPPSDNR